MNPMQVVEIKEIRKETRRIKTFILDLDVNAIPGQFVMVWIPDVNEKPMSISFARGDLGITVLEVGEFTRKLHNMKEGEKIGIRGPMGRGYKVYGKKLVIVGGGVGMAPVTPLGEEALREGREVTVIAGALTKSELLFAQRLKEAGARVLVATDDGTQGHKGYTTEVLAELLEKESFDQAFTCGPEIMMYKVLNLCREKKIPTQLSMERYFKCGIGICGQCVLDGTGLRVCKEGPVFRDREIIKSVEFGKYKRDAAGTKVFYGGRK